MKNDRVFISLIWIEFIVFTVHYDLDMTTPVNRGYLWGRHTKNRVVRISDGLFLLLCFSLTIWYKMPYGCKVTLEDAVLYREAICKMVSLIFVKCTEFNVICCL